MRNRSLQREKSLNKHLSTKPRVWVASKFGVNILFNKCLLPYKVVILITILFYGKGENGTVLSLELINKKYREPAQATVAALTPLGEFPDHKAFSIQTPEALQSLIGCFHSFSINTQNNSNFRKDRKSLKIIHSWKESEWKKRKL